MLGTVRGLVSSRLTSAPMRNLAHHRRSGPPKHAASGRGPPAGEVGDGVPPAGRSGRATRVPSRHGPAHWAAGPDRPGRLPQRQLDARGEECGRLLCVGKIAPTPLADHILRLASPARVVLPPEVCVQFDAGFALEMSPFGDHVVLARFAGAGLQVEVATISPVWGSRRWAALCRTGAFVLCAPAYPCLVGHVPSSPVPQEIVREETAGSPWLGPALTSVGTTTGGNGS